jgi:hypothetical protein
MKNKTVRVIAILVGLLVLNIEAAHAGITHKFRVLIASELSNFQLLYMGGGLLTLAFFSYVIFTPAFKENGKAPLSNSYFDNYARRNYRQRRAQIRKISEILRDTRAGN